MSPNLKADSRTSFVRMPVVGKVLRMRYKVMYQIGSGTFGDVYAAVDITATPTQKVAIKTIKDAISSKNEISALERLRRLDPLNKFPLIQLYDVFKDLGRYCLVMPMLGKSIFEFQQANRHYRFSIDEIKQLSYQMCLALCFLHRNGIIHTDFKSNNIVLVDSVLDGGSERKLRCTDIKVVDFGSVIYTIGERKPSVVTSKPYRAPEVTLQLKWSVEIDIWSLGCVLHELYVGHPRLLDYETEIEQLAAIQWYFGTFPDWMRETTPKENYFRGLIVNHGKAFKFPHSLRESNFRFLEAKYAKPHTDLFDLMEKMLKEDPIIRISALQATKDPFFSEIHSEQNLW